MGWSDYVPVFYGKIAIVSYLFSILTLIVFWTKVFPPALSEPWSIAPLVLLEAAYVGVLSAFCRRQVAQVVLCSHVLGLVFAAGCLVLASGRLFVYFGAYMMSLSFFHLSEYVLTAVYNPHTLSMDSFLVNHSLEYTVAAVASWLEYWAEYYFLPEYKCLHLVNWVGLALVVGGELMRKAAMVTAGKNFTHTVMYMKRTGHRLVTKGVYAWFRHPSYVGWFYWSIGTQVLLCNPICAVSYSVASWMFFNDRIHDEEEHLMYFFGQDYVDYKRKVPSGIPLITGAPLK